MPTKSKRLRYIFIIYWILLAYILAALIWWFIALNMLNSQMTQFEIQQLQPGSDYESSLQNLYRLEKRKTTQYIGEGVTFFLLIIAGAIFVYRAVRRQLKISQQQQNFMIAITHELKTPISVAKLNLETMQKRVLDEQQQKRLISNTLEETNRLNTLCNNMLLSSQIEAGGYVITNEEINLGELISSAVQDFQNRYPQQDLQLDAEPDIFIKGDLFLLQILVNNLVDNAIKYSSKETPVNIVLTQQDSYCIFKVMDQGKGIETGDKEKIFKKFYRAGNAATKAAKGTGLGLYLVKKIAHQHQAGIAVIDNDPAGTIFQITFKVFEDKN